MATKRPRLKYDVFISYQWDDKAKAKELKRFLEKHKLNVWMDEYKVNLGHGLNSQLQDAIYNSRILVACITKKYCLSQNCTSEYNFADRVNCEMSRDQDIKITIPVMFENVKHKYLENGMGLKLSGIYKLHAFEKENWKEELYRNIRHSL